MTTHIPAADTIPGELRQFPNWVNASGKVPIDPKTGTAASTTDPATWGTLEQALARAGSDKLGIGFIVSRDTGIVAVDIDGCIDADGNLSEDATAIVSALNTYTERSRSGRGLHLLMWSDPKPGDRCKNTTRKIEMYEHARFMVVTGDHLEGTPDTLEERTAAVAELYRELWPADDRPTLPRAASAPIGETADDETILARLRRVPRFGPLWDGDTSAHDGNDSSADLSLANLFVWAGASEAQADALFRMSGLYRAKWDSRRGNTTYGGVTLNKAFRTQTVGDWRSSPPARTPARAVMPQDAVSPVDRDEIPLPDDIDELKQIIRELTAALDAERLARLELEARVTTLSELQSRNAGILRNRRLGAERQTAVAVANILANREGADPTPDGMHVVYLGAVAEAAGVSTDAAARHLDRLAEMDTGLRKETRTVRTERGVEKRVYLGLEPGSNVIQFAARVAAAEPETARNGWGGRRATCPTCGPETPVMKRTEFVCTGCGEVLETRQEIVKPQDAGTGDGELEVNPQDAGTGTSEAAGDVNPQDAGSGSGRIPRRGTYVDTAAERDTIAPAGGALPLLPMDDIGEAGADRWTA